MSCWDCILLMKVTYLEAQSADWWFCVGNLLEGNVFGLESRLLLNALDGPTLEGHLHFLDHIGTELGLCNERSVDLIDCSDGVE